MLFARFFNWHLSFNCMFRWHSVIFVHHPVTNFRCETQGLNSHKRLKINMFPESWSIASTLSVVGISDASPLHVALHLIGEIKLRSRSGVPGWTHQFDPVSRCSFKVPDAVLPTGVETGPTGAWHLPHWGADLVLAPTCNSIHHHHHHHRHHHHRRRCHPLLYYTILLLHYSHISKV